MSTPKIEYKNRYKRYSIMQVQIRNLQRRASGYFFRMGIPKDLRNHFDGKREIVKSLKTRDSNLAVNGLVQGEVKACEASSDSLYSLSKHGLYSYID